jgi:hypothetical protein
MQSVGKYKTEQVKKAAVERKHVDAVVEACSQRHGRISDSLFLDQRTTKSLVFHKAKAKLVEQICRLTGLVLQCR